MPRVNVGNRYIFHAGKRYGPDEVEMPQTTVDRLLNNGAIKASDVQAAPEGFEDTEVGPATEVPAEDAAPSRKGKK